MNKEYYIYRHIRLDTHIVFYIGMGEINHKGKFVHTKYNRAYVKRNRNKYWNNVVNSTSYEIDIIFKSNDISEIVKKEIEFIALYKRKCDGGTLCNFSTGGEFGASGVTFSKERLKLLSKRQIEYVKNNPSPLSVEVFQYDIHGNLLNQSSNIHEMAKLCNMNHYRVRKYLNDSSKSLKCSGYIFSKNPLTKTMISSIQIEHISRIKKKKDSTISKRLKRKKDWVISTKDIPYFKQNSKFNNMIAYNMRKTTRHDKYIKMIGCTFNELKVELELRFLKTMSWDNYGKNGWSIYKSVYDTLEEDETKIKTFFHHTNLVPKWNIF